MRFLDREFSVGGVSKEMRWGLHGRSSLGIGVDWAHKGVHLMRGGVGGGGFGDLGVGYAGRSQRCMRGVNRSGARVRSCGIDVLRVECVREVSGRVWGSIWGAGAL